MIGRLLCLLGLHSTEIMSTHHWPTGYTYETHVICRRAHCKFRKELE